MQICTLASSSRGNALVVSCGGLHILLDAGISALRIRKGLEELGLSVEQLSAILITHEHSDHTKGLTTLLKKYQIPVYATCGTEPALRNLAVMPGDLFRPVVAGQPFWIGDVEVLPFATPHDTAGSVGYRIGWRGVSMALATDLGHITPAVLEGVCGVDFLVAEANHDEDWVRTSPYPYGIQRRILGDFGHLSNEVGMELVVQAIRGGTQAVLLAHLSPENNTPAHAMEMARRRLCAEGIELGRDVHLSVAPAMERSEVFCIEQGGVRILQEVSVC